MAKPDPVAVAIEAQTVAVVLRLERIAEAIEALEVADPPAISDVTAALDRIVDVLDAARQGQMGP